MEIERDKGAGVYKIIDTVGGKIYIGSTLNFYRRSKLHIYYLKYSKHQPKIQKCCDENGSESLVFEIIEKVEMLETETKDEFRKRLYDIEQKYMDELLSASSDRKKFHEMSLNIWHDCRAAKGVSLPEETKRKIGHSVRKRFSENPLNRVYGTPWNKGIKTGKNEKSSNTKKEKFKSGETTPWNLGKNHSDETKNKIREKAIKRGNAGRVGEKSPTPKLTSEQVIEIRTKYEGMKYSDIAKIYNVTSGNIACIIKRKSWKHI